MFARLSSIGCFRLSSRSTEAPPSSTPATTPNKLAGVWPNLIELHPSNSPPQTVRTATSKQTVPYK